MAAIRTGVKNATGDIIIITDADFTYPAKYIKDFLTSLDNGADLVLGSRQLSRENIPLFNKIGNTLFSSVAGFISSRHIIDSQTGYRALRREMFNKFDVNAAGLEFETKMTVRAAKLGYKIVEIPIEYRKRVGKSKLKPIRDGIRMFSALLTIGWYETSPLGKTILFISFIFIFIGFVFSALSIYEKLTVFTNVYYPLIAVFSMLMGVQLMSLGLVIDYMTKKLDRIEERLL